MEKVMDNSSYRGISYKTYLRMRKILPYTGLGSYFININMQAPEQLELLISVMGIMGSVASVLMEFSDKREIKEIKDLYQTFIKNYNELNRIFNLNNPIQIYTMYQHLVWNGYLSTGKKFEFSSNQVCDISGITGAYIITGKGVCRHISSMLADILNDYSIEAGSLVACIENANAFVENLDEQKYTKEELIKWIHSHPLDDKAITYFTNLIESLDADNNLKIEFQYEREKEESIIQRIIGNHSITYAYKDGIIYYLDPTNDDIYRPNGRLLTTPGSILFPKIFLSSHVDDSRNNKTKRRLKQGYPCIDIEEEERIKAETLDICEANTDIFEQFYRENEELYDDTSKKILSIKKLKDK